MKRIFRRIFSKAPNSVRLVMGRNWRLRSAIDRLLIGEIDRSRLLEDTNIFFLLGSGRCGTMVISSILNRAPGALVLHEPNRHSDVGVRPQCRSDPDFARAYVERFRVYQIYKKIREHGCRSYGEVSSPLRCLGAALQGALPHTRFFILVRDGRDTVASAVNRQASKQDRHNHAPLRPPPDDPYTERWASMSPFARGCWWWMDAYRTLLDQLPEAPIVHFEDILGDWDYVQTNLIKPIGLEITQRDWQQVTSRKSRNTARQYVVAKSSEWTDDQHADFNRICGEMMTRVGYENGA